MKKLFLAAFMVISTGLVLSIWADNVFEKDNANPYYYRETIAADGSLYITLTSIAEKNEPETPRPGKGQGQNGHDHGMPSPVTTQTPPSHMSPSATIDWDVIEMDK